MASFIGWCFCLPGQAAAAQNEPTIPALQGHVNDVAGVFSSAEKKRLDARLQAYEQQTQAQFVVLTVPTLAGSPIEEYTLQVAQAWRLGQAKQDNGLLLLVAVNDRQMRFEIGYGLEGQITDALSKRLITEVLRPAFRRGAYVQGIEQAMTILMEVHAGKSVDVLLPKQNENSAEPASNFLGLFILLALLLFLGPGFMLPLLAAVLSGGPRGPWNGSGGGGFSGGGGSFGGGGASGNW